MDRQTVEIERTGPGEYTAGWGDDVRELCLFAETNELAEGKIRMLFDAFEHPAPVFEWDA